MPRTLPFKDQSIRAAAYGGSGRETDIGLKAIRAWCSLFNGPIGAASVPRSGGPTTLVSKALKRKLRLGKFPAVNLAQARKLAAEVAEAVEMGRDPVAEGRTASAARTQRPHPRRSDRRIHRRSAALTRDNGERDRARAEAGHRPDAWAFAPGRHYRLPDRGGHRRRREAGNAMARHLLVYLRGVYNHALRGSPQLRHRYGLTHNPADNVGRGRRGKPGKYGKPPVDDRHLSDAEISLLWKALEPSEADPRTVLALKLLLLTGARPGEVVRAQISELRLMGSEPTWLLPAQRTKNGLPHLVPLVPLCVQLFAAAIGNRDRGRSSLLTRRRMAYLGNIRCGRRLRDCLRTGG